MAAGEVAGGGVAGVAAGAAAGFRGWPAAATVFLAELAADNTARFWSAERHRHTEAVLMPLRALAAELAAEFGELRIFRPYRDRRFRPDAPPYRTDAGGVCFSAGGTARAVVLSGSALPSRSGGLRSTARPCGRTGPRWAVAELRPVVRRAPRVAGLRLVVRLLRRVVVRHGPRRIVVRAGTRIPPA